MYLGHVAGRAGAFLKEEPRLPKKHLFYQARRFYCGDSLYARSEVRAS